MPEVVEVNRLEDLDQYYLVWQSLVSRTRNATFFHSLPWLKACLAHFGQDATLRVLFVKEGTEYLGIVPLVVVTETTRVGRVRSLTYPLRDWGSFYGPIGPQPAATLVAALRHITTTHRDWDLLDLRWIDKSGVDRGRTATAFLAARVVAREQPWKQTALIDFSGSWETYLGKRQAKFRENIMRHERRLDDLGNATYIRYRPLGHACGESDPRWDLYEDCLEVAAKSWQGASTSGTTLTHAAVRDFLRETHELAAKAGALDLNLLYVGDRPIAFGYGYHWRGHVTGLRTGYDPEFARVGPGRVLTAHTIRDSFERGDRQFDLGPDFFEAKQPWLTRVATTYRYTHYSAGSLRAQALRCKHWFDGRKRQVAAMNV